MRRGEDPYKVVKAIRRQVVVGVCVSADVGIGFRIACVVDVVVGGVVYLFFLLLLPRSHYNNNAIKRKYRWENFQLRNRTNQKVWCGGRSCLGGGRRKSTSLPPLWTCVCCSIISMFYCYNYNNKTF